MSAFYDNNITNKGRELLTELMGGASFKPTRISIGQGYMPIGTTTRNITDLVAPVKDLEINKNNKLPPNAEIPEGAYVFGGMFSNEDVTSDFYFRELGLYAKAVRTDGTETDEILYSYGNADDNAELIPAYSTTTVLEKQMDLIVYIGNDTTVTLEVASGITVTQEEFNFVISNIEKTISDLDTDIDNRISGMERDIDNLETSISNLKSELESDFSSISTDSTFLLSTSGWGNENTQTVTLTGFTSNMKSPIVDVVASSIEEDDEWAKIWKIETVEGGMKFYAKEKVGKNLTVKYKVVI